MIRILCVLFVSVWVSACATQDYTLNEVASHIESKWGDDLKLNEITSIRLGYVLYEFGDNKRIVVARDKELLICNVTYKKLAGCDEVVKIDTHDNISRIVDLRIQFSQDDWVVISKGPSNHYLSSKQLSVIDHGIETLIRSGSLNR